MSVRSIIETASLGATILVSHGTPRPPARFHRKVADWERRNFSGTLIRTEGGSAGQRASITIHEGDLAANGVIVVTIHPTFGIDSPLRFEVQRRPKPGSARVVRAGRRELLHLAADRIQAGKWLTAHRHGDAVIEDVPEPETKATTEEA